ncbi:MAG TPA: DUF6659 family protein [Nitrososphaeraceae archaeon]|nr:DUF6659 family protein [Nitrososphaeraceae archaeon]
MDYSWLCKEIFRIDQKIRFAAICDRNGEIKYGGLREGLTSLLSSDQTKESVQQAWNRWKLRNAMESSIGKGKFSMTEYEKVKRFTLPVDNEHLLLVSTEVDADLSIIYNILRLIHD